MQKAQIINTETTIRLMRIELDQMAAVLRGNTAACPKSIARKARRIGFLAGCLSEQLEPDFNPDILGMTLIEEGCQK